MGAVMVDVAAKVNAAALRWGSVVLLGSALLTGCAQVSESRTYRFEVSESLPNSAVAPSQGVEICEVDTDNCVTTDPFGRASIQVPPNREVAFTFNKEGYGPLLVPDVSDETYGGVGLGDGSPSTWRIYPEEQLQAVAQQLGTLYPWEGGIVGLRVADPSGLAGVTFTPVGSTSGSVGESYYFDSESDEYSLDLEATTRIASGWALPVSEGGFTEVAPGEQQFEFGGTAVDCPRLSWAWPVENEPRRIRVPVRAGYMTYGSIVCD
jgi:hypothetical protein